MHARTLTATLVGNILAWYDFSLYGHFFILFSERFFPSHHSSTALLLTLMVFSLSFLIRPIGGYYLARLADRSGRKIALQYSLWIMAIATFSMALLPEYAQVGLLAPLSLIILRLAQGFAIGGESVISMTYVMEYVIPEERGWYGALIMLASVLGVVLGAFAQGCTLQMAHSSLWPWPEESWRLPFFLGGLIAWLGIYIRKNIPETEAFLNRPKEEDFLFWKKLREHKKNLMRGLWWAGLPSLGFYLNFVYLNTHLQSALGLSTYQVISINTASMSTIILFLPWLGALSDRIGRRRMFRLCALGFTLLSVPLYILIQAAKPLEILGIQMIFGFLIAIGYATLPAWLAEQFPTAIRCSAISLPYNLANAIFGGTAPALAALLIERTHLSYAPGLYLSWIGFCAGVITFTFRQAERWGYEIPFIKSEIEGLTNKPPHQPTR